MGTVPEIGANLKVIAPFFKSQTISG